MRSVRGLGPVGSPCVSEQETANGGLCRWKDCCEAVVKSAVGGRGGLTRVCRAGTGGRQISRIVRLELTGRMRAVSARAPGVRSRTVIQKKRGGWRRRSVIITRASR